MFSVVALADLNFGNVHLLLGNPSAATQDPANANNYLILRPQYALSYSRDKGIPNWVSWQLNANWLGNLPRRPFAPDLTLPKGWYPVRPNDYNGSGFDRGHMTPAADRDRTDADSQAVFLMTNILPQSPNNNQGRWAALESDCRAWVQQGKELYIIAGGAETGGEGKDGKATTIANGKIAVPAQSWKVIVVNDRPGQGVTEKTRVIAVILPNTQGIKGKDWRSFRKSVRDVEAFTGYNLLSNVPQKIQDEIETKVDIL